MGYWEAVTLNSRECPWARSPSFPSPTCLPAGLAKGSADIMQRWPCRR